MTLPSNLPSIANAKLPAVYESARAALEKCERIDECKEWKDKAAAMASYAKQARDESLLKIAVKIKAQASARCGDLMREQEKGQRGPRAAGIIDGTVNNSSQRKLGKESGLSDREIETALKISNIPKAERDALIESDSPPTLTELAAIGTKARPKPLIDLGGRNPADVRAATEAQGALRRFAEVTGQVDPRVAVRGSFPREFPSMLDHARATAEWCRRLIPILEKQK